MERGFETMKTEVHIIYFEGCPNVEVARRNLKEAITSAGLKDVEWKEVDVSRPGAPDIWKGFPSPTILVNGFDVESGMREALGTGACRLGGAPQVERIIEGLKRFAPDR